MIVETGTAVVSVAVKLTFAPQSVAVVLTVIFVGHLITGTAPNTVTLKEHSAESPTPSVTVYVTVVSPIGKTVSLAKPDVLTVMAPKQLSVPTGVI